MRFIAITKRRGLQCSLRRFVCHVIFLTYVETMYYIVSLSSSSAIVCRSDVLHRLYKRAIESLTHNKLQKSKFRYNHIEKQTGADYIVISTCLRYDQHLIAVQSAPFYKPCRCQSLFHQSSGVLLMTRTSSLVTRHTSLVSLFPDCGENAHGDNCTSFPATQAS